MSVSLTAVDAVDPLLLFARRQSILNWGFTIATLSLYFLYVLLMVCARPALSAPIMPGVATSWAVVLGYALLVLSMALTAVHLFIRTRWIEPRLAELAKAGHV